MARKYVASTGSNSNPGNTPAAPYQTIAFAYAAISSGDTITILDEGPYYLYTDNAGNGISLAKKYITIEGARASADKTGNPTGLPTLIPGRLTTAGNWTYDAVVGEYYYTLSGSYRPLTIFDPSLSTQMKAVPKIDNLDDLTAGTFCIDEESSPPRLYYSPGQASPAANPGSLGVIIPTDTAFFKSSNTDNAADGITFRNLRFKYWSDYGLFTNDHDNWSILDCYFDRGYGPGVIANSDRLTLRGSHFFYIGETFSSNSVAIDSDITGAAIHLDSAKNSLVTRNYIRYCSVGGILVESNSESSPAPDEGLNLVCDNYVANQYASYSSTTPQLVRGVYAATGTCENKNLFLRNYAISCGSAAVSCYSASNAIFLHTTAYDCLSGLYLDGTLTDNIICNNIFAENGKSWTATYSFSNSGKYKNDAGYFVDAPTEAQLEEFKTNYIEKNIYYRSLVGNQTSAIYQFRYGGTFYDLEGWQNLAAKDISSLSSSPGFVSTGDYDYTINDASTALEFALNLKEYITEFDSRYTQNLYDCGAYQFSRFLEEERKDVRYYLTGNTRSDSTTWGVNTSSNLSTGGIISTPYTYSQSIVLNLNTLFNNVGGSDLTNGKTQYRAVDIKCSDIRPYAGSNGIGQKMTNFNSLIGGMQSFRVYIYSQPRNKRRTHYNFESPTIEAGTATTTVAIGWENLDASPGSDPNPLSADTTAPTGVTFSSPATASDAIICPEGTLLPQRTLNGETLLDGEVGRLWIRRTIEPGATYELEDFVELRFLFSTTTQAFNEDETLLLYLNAEEY